METRSKVSGGYKPLKKKAVGAAIWQSEHQKFQIFLHTRHALGNQHEIRIAFFKRDKYRFKVTF